jgi:hypothetical protein
VDIQARKSQHPDHLQLSSSMNGRECKPEAERKRDSAQLQGMAQPSNE